MVVNVLEDLNIVNGELTPEFDIYNNIYSVSVAGYVDELVIDYEVTDGYVVNVIDFPVWWPTYRFNLIRSTFASSSFSKRISLFSTVPINVDINKCLKE